jgi:hypothetical protein
MSPKQRFPVMLEPGQVAALKAIERETGAPVGEQIRRAIGAYLESQKVLPKAEIRKLLGG